MIKCNICNLDNLPPDHFMSVLHMEKQIQYDRDRIDELNKDA